jgi:hypothetical protein
MSFFIFLAWIFDITRSYHLAFFIAGGFFACAACLAILTQLLSSQNTNISYKTVLTTKPDIEVYERNGFSAGVRPKSSAHSNRTSKDKKVFV